MKKILFVEDNEVLLELYGMLLDAGRDQWQTTLAPNGEAALKILQQTAFDVVASDMQMPGINGIELLTEVRKLHPQTSRIIISGLRSGLPTGWKTGRTRRRNCRWNK